jgi:hypothetical protein
MAHGTWFHDLMRPNVVTNKWIFKHKFKANGTLDRYKACWVTQCLEVDYDETFSPIMKPIIIQIVLTLGWPIHQLDIKNAFLHDTLTEVSRASLLTTSSPKLLQHTTTAL